MNLFIIKIWLNFKVIEAIMNRIFFKIRLKSRKNNFVLIKIVRGIGEQ